MNLLWTEKNFFASLPLWQPHRVLQVLLGLEDLESQLEWAVQCRGVMDNNTPSSRCCGSQDGYPYLEAETQDVMILGCPGRWRGRLSLEVSIWNSRSNSILDQGRKVGMMVG